jgi:hypothetical protein
MEQAVSFEHLFGQAQRRKPSSNSHFEPPGRSQEVNLLNKKRFASFLSDAASNEFEP